MMKNNSLTPVIGMAALLGVAMWAGGAMDAKPADKVKLTRVVDGDTAYVMYRHKVAVLTKLRFLRIDTPERGKRYYKEATDALRNLLTDKKLRLEFEKENHYQTDRYGRALVYVYADGKNVNLEMVRLGWSKFYVKYGEGKYADQFRAAEKEAREARRGLWK
jgi:micrococcal nuclease